MKKTERDHFLVPKICHVITPRMVGTFTHLEPHMTARHTAKRALRLGATSQIWMEPQLQFPSSLKYHQTQPKNTKGMTQPCGTSVRAARLELNLLSATK